MKKPPGVPLRVVFNTGAGTPKTKPIRVEYWFNHLDGYGLEYRSKRLNSSKTKCAVV